MKRQNKIKQKQYKYKYIYRKEKSPTPAHVMWNIVTRSRTSSGFSGMLIANDVIFLIYP